MIQSVKCSVPQGSILGRLLFLTYIDDLDFVSDISFTFMFADDASIFVRNKNIAEISAMLNTGLAKMSSWLHANRLSFNVDKASLMLVKWSNV